MCRVALPICEKKLLKLEVDDLGWLAGFAADGLAGFAVFAGRGAGRAAAAGLAVVAGAGFVVAGLAAAGLLAAGRDAGADDDWRGAVGAGCASSASMNSYSN